MEGRGRGIKHCYKGSNASLIPSVHKFLNEGFFDRTKRSHSARALGPLLVAPIGRDALQQVILKVTMDTLHNDGHTPFPLTAPY